MKARDKLDSCLSPDGDITAHEAIQVLCQLTENIMDEALGFSEASDCFCGTGGWRSDPHSSDYRNTGRTLKFIIAAVEEKIKRGGSH